MSWGSVLHSVLLKIAVIHAQPPRKCEQVRSCDDFSGTFARHFPRLTEKG